MSKRLHPEIPGYRQAHESHHFERVHPNGEKIWSGYAKCACGAQRFYGPVGESCQDKAVKPCPLAESEPEEKEEWKVLI